MKKAMDRAIYGSIKNGLIVSATNLKKAKESNDEKDVWFFWGCFAALYRLFYRFYPTQTKSQWFKKAKGIVLECCS